MRVIIALFPTWESIWLHDFWTPGKVLVVPYISSKYGKQKAQGLPRVRHCSILTDTIRAIVYGSKTKLAWILTATIIICYINSTPSSPPSIHIQYDMTGSLSSQDPAHSHDDTDLPSSHELGLSRDDTDLPSVDDSDIHKDIEKYATT